MINSEIISKNPCVKRFGYGAQKLCNLFFGSPDLDVNLNKMIVEEIICFMENTTRLDCRLIPIAEMQQQVAQILLFIFLCKSSIQPPKDLSNF